MLNLNNIKKDYVTGESVVSALKGVDIKFRENEFVSILGPSGCGKTTLLNIIGGLDQYTDGDLIIGEKSTKNFKDADWDSYRNHKIGFIFQSYNLIPHQTVLSNVELALTLSGVPKAERKKRAKEALEQVGLGDQLNKKPNQMSGGQMQRVAIARALVNNPDILLADEPTGALDTETSIQVMEILKSISKDKLIIMVTHNPDLAMQYSSRIIRLLDGKVIDDSDHYVNNVVEPISKAEQPADKKALKKEKKNLKTSMSFLTALSLSKNNLMTKKARTLLTSFAGSIGIIGIALILALSNGVQVYIDQVQGDTLSSYPLTITKTTTSIGDIMETMVTQGEKTGNHDMDKIYSQNQMSTMVNTLMEETKINDLKKFKNFLDSNEELKGYTTDIQYTYSTTPYVYMADTTNGVEQVNPSTVMDEMGFGEAMNTSTQMQEAMGMGSMGGGMMGGAGQDAFSEMIDNDDLINSQYDILAGKMPEKYDEVVLVVDKNNELNDYVLYTLGLLDKSKLSGAMQKIISGQELNLDTKQVSYTYEDLMSQKFKLIAPTDKYEKNGDSWVDMSQDESFMKKAVENGLELKVVGILRPNDEASAASIGGAIGYRHDMMTYLLERVNDSEIVKQQLDNPDTDVFTGLKFKTEQSETTPEADNSSTADSTAQTSSSADDTSSIDMSELTDEQKAQLAAAQTQDTTSQGGESAMAAMGSSGTMDLQSMMSGNSSQLTDAQKKYIASLTDEQMALLQQMTVEQMQSSQLAQTDGQFSNSTYDENIEALGYSPVDNPSNINIYPKDFASKEKIIDLIDNYNNNAKDAGNDSDVIEYTDYVGLMMSSITTIINAISYILIAFVAISLVVSSIMIGIITYISVLERTKEIGILRAIGASKTDISRVFNAETVIVGLVAGCLGIGISYLLTIPINMIIASVTDVPMRASIPVIGAVILIAISVILTLIAGLFPSKVAAKKDPVIALRTE